MSNKLNKFLQTGIQSKNLRISYTSRLDYIKNMYKFKTEKCAVDSGYDTLDIKKYFMENNIFGVIGHRRYGTPESRQEKTRYYYIQNLMFM